MDIPATSSNMPGTLVLRDASGNLSAGQITGNLTGNVTGNVTGNLNGNVTGNVTGNLNGNVTGNLTGTASAIADNSVTSAKIVDGTIVDADISNTANISDTKLNTISTANKVSNSATTATSSNTPNAIVSRDGDGRFIHSATQVFRAWAGTSTGVTPSTWTVVTLNSESFDPSGVFASSRFTPTVAGYYLLNGTIRWAGLGAIVRAIAGILKNGIVVAQGVEDDTMRRCSVSDVVYMNGTTDFIQLGAFQGSTSNYSVNVGESGTYLSGVFIGS